MMRKDFWKDFWKGRKGKAHLYRDRNRDRNRSKITLSRVLPNVGSSQPTGAMDAMDATDATCKDVAALPKPSGNAESLGRSDSLQAVLRWHEQGQKRLSIGLELECYLPDLGTGYGEQLGFFWEKLPKSNCLILFKSVHHDLSLLK